MNNTDRIQRIALRVAGTIAVLAFLVAIPLILDAGFAAEDFLIEPRASVPWGSAVVGYFSASDPEAIHYYRPATRAVQRTAQVFFGTNGEAFHAWNLALHLLATCLVYRLALSLTTDRATGVIAALVFLVHPAHDEPIIWLSGISGLTETVCHLAALVVYDRFLTRSNASTRSGIAPGLLVVALFMAGMLFKESGISLVLTLPLLWWYRGQQRRRLWPIAGVVAGAIAIGLWRMSLGVNSSLALDNLSSNPLTWVRNLLFYTTQFLVPVRSMFRVVGFENYYRWRDLLPATPATWAYAALIVLTTVVLVTMLWRFRRAITRTVWLSTALAVASLAPLLISRYTGMRLMYLFSGLLAIALAVIVVRASKSRWMIPAFALWLIIMSVSFVERGEAWRESGDLAGRIFKEALAVGSSAPAGSTVIFRGIPARHLGGFVFPVTFSEAILKRTGDHITVVNYDDPHEEISRMPETAIWYLWNGAEFVPSSAPLND